MIGKLDKEIIEKFKEFQEKTGKHSELYIEDVEFENISLSNKKYFTFIKGKNKYIQRYIQANKGDYPILGSSLKNSCISAYIKPIDESDIINKKSVTFNKDNAKGSVPFFRDYPYLMDRHHIAIIPNDKLIDAKYLEKTLIHFFEKSAFGWGDNVADVTAVQKHLVPIPKDLNKFYSSYQIQEAIVEFLEYSFENIKRIRQRIDERYSIFERLKKALIPSTFKKDYVKVAFCRYTKEKGIGFNITDVEFYENKIGEFINSKGGSNAYNKTYINNNKGAYPLYTGAKDIVAFVKEIDKSDIITAESVSYNKDNDAGSRAFYHKEPYIIGGHHYSLTIKKEYQNEILTKYFYYCMENIFSRNKFYQSKKPVANIGLIKEFFIFIPKDLKDYTSLEIQEIIADFIEYTEKRLQKEFDRMDTAYHNLDRLYNTYLGRTFRLIDWGGKS